MRFLVFAFLTSFSVIGHAEGLGAVTPSIQAEATVPLATSAADDSKIKTDNRKESEIALNLDANKKANAGDNSVFRILFSLSMLGVVGTGAFFFLRKYAVPKGMKTQTQIKILQQHYLGPKKSLAIVRVAGESILIGITEQNISMIKSLSLIDDEVPEESPNQFSNVLGKLESPFETPTKEDNENREDFSFGGIRDVVSKRLKGMRNLE